MTTLVLRRLNGKRSPKRAQITLRFGQPKAQAKKIAKQTMKGAHTNHESQKHTRVQAGTLPARNHGLRMLRPPPADGHVIDRDIHKSDDAYHGSKCRTAPWPAENAE